MTNKMMYISPCDYSHLSDSDAIQSAVYAAAEKDIRTVLIPASKKWCLEKTVYLPNNITIILNGAHIYSNGIAFTNANAGNPDNLCLGGEQEHLYLLGTKGASIATQQGPQVYFCNVKNYGVKNIDFVGGDGLRLLHCRFGKIQQMQFHQSRYGVFLGEGCNNNLLEDILAETKAEAVLWSAGDTSVWGRSSDIYDSSLCRLDAKTEGAPAVSLYAGPVVANNLFIRDVTDRTAGDGITVRLGNEDQKELLDLTVRGVATSRTAVAVSDSCDGVFLANLQGAPYVLSPSATRTLVDESTEAIQPVQFPVDMPAEFVSANDPRYTGATDSETLQNAINDAAGKCLVIPRYNAHTGCTVWNIEKTLRLPSDTTLLLVDAHLRLADFTYCNLFSNAEAPVKNIHIHGLGSATVDSGSFNGLKVKNANTLGFGPITDNALLLFTGVDGLTVEGLHMVQNRWYCMLCVGCTNGRLGNLDICAHPNFPDMGGIRIHSGCHDMLVENITGLTGEDTILVCAQKEDDNLFRPANSDISNIHIRTVNTNASRCCMVNINAYDGRGIQHILIETLLDCSVPEQKKQPNACVKVGDISGDNLSDIVIRDLSSRSSATVQMGGNSEAIRVSNLHAYGSSINAVRTVPLPEVYDYFMLGVPVALIEQGSGYRAHVKNWHINGIFFRCHQASSYMRGTATSIITDKKKYIGTVVNLYNLQAKDFRIENILADRIGNGIQVTGNATVEVQNFQVNELGREIATCGSNCCLTVNGETIPVTAARAL